MFDIGFSELMVIGIVALVVIGPERLPRVAKTLGHLMGRAQRYVSDVKADINREIQLDELKKLQASVTEQARSIGDSVRTELDAAKSAVESPARAAAADLEATARAAEAGVGQARAAIKGAPTLPPENQDKPAA